MADPYTIRIFVPDGNPEGLRIIDRTNWTGLGIAFPREDWRKVKTRDGIVQNTSQLSTYIVSGQFLGP